MGSREDADGSSPLVDKQVLVLGAGGVARSIAFGLARRGANLTITSRHDERATSLAEEVGCRMVTWSQRATSIADVIVNCTPVGMHPHLDDTPLPPAAFPRPGIVVFDTVYHPENTMLLKLARERQAVTITGVDMFLRQAAHQFKIYTEKEAPLDVMAAALKRKLGPLREE
jgi:3-dehydroquinate dehydratase / shikimate dehydrogenase